MEQEESSFLTQDYITKLQSSKQYGAGTKEKYRSMEQERDPEINPCIISGHFTFNKEGMNIPWGKDNLFNTWFWENWTAMCKRMKLEYHT